MAKKTDTTAPTPDDTALVATLAATLLSSDGQWKDGTPDVLAQAIHVARHLLALAKLEA